MELVQLAKEIEKRGASDMAKRILQIVGMVFRYSVAHGYSGSRVAVHRNRAIKWRFPQENATFHRTEQST
jgi:hypothetical protein